MPSPRHDAINRLFRDRPELAVEILRELMGADVPANLPVRLESNDFNDRPSKDFRPDTVITVGSPQEPAHGIVVEVQQKKSDAKRRQLPRYAATLWLMLKCPVTVLCVCPDPAAATWYAEPIHTELSGFTFQAAVLGPRDVPMIISPEAAALQPELAVMAVMVHGCDRSVLETFMSALELFKPEHAPKYYEHAYDMAAPAVQRLLEKLMDSTTWPVHSPFARQHYGRGKTDGRKEGRAEGRAEGEADAILKVLSTRGIQVTEDTRARIRACGDTRQLDTWLHRAVTAASADELFG